MLLNKPKSTLLSLNMVEIVVIGPLSDGLHHLGYQSEGSDQFYTIDTFTSRELAQAMADKMLRDRAREGK